MILKLARLMRPLVQRYRANEKASMATEFALTLPIYLAVVTLLIEGARIVYIKSAVNYAAEEATRYSLVSDGASTTDISNKAKASLTGVNINNLSTIVVTAPVDSSDQTRLVTVTIEFRYIPILPVDYLLKGNRQGFMIKGESSGFLAEEITVL